MEYQNKSKEELLLEINALKAQFDALKLECLNQELSLKNSNIKFNNLNNDYLKLNEFAINLAYLPYQEIYPYAISKFNEFFGVNEIWISSYDAKESTLIVENSSLSDDKNLKVKELLGQNIVGFKISLNHEQYEEIISKNCWTFSSLSKVTFGAIPENVEELLQKIIGIDWISAIPLLYNGNLVGTVIIIGDSSKTPPATENILSFTGIIANALVRKKAEEALIERERNYSEIFNATSDALFILETSNGKILDVNNAMLKMYGYSNIQEVLETSIKDLSALNWEFTLEKIKSALTESRANNVSYFNWQAKKKDGTLFWVEISLKTTYIGGRDKILVIARDINERKITEAALDKSETQYANLFNSMPNGYYRSTPEGYFVEINPAFVKMLGYKSKNELLSIHIPSDLLVNTKERNKLIADNDKFIEAIETYRLKTKDGRIIWIEDNARYIKDSKGKTIYKEGICHEITERKRSEEALKYSEERFRQMADMLPQTVFEVDLKGNFLFVNRMSYEIFGYTQKDFKKGLNILSMLIPEEHQKAIENIKQVYSGVPVKGNEYIAIKNDGTQFPVLIYSSIILENNKPTGIRGIVVDISDTKKAEAAISHTRAQLQGLLDAATEISIIATDPAGKIIVFNKGAEKMLGYTENEVLGKLSVEFIHLKSEILTRSEELSIEYNRRIEGFEVFIEPARHNKTEIKEWTYVHKDGSYIIVNLRITAVYNELNEIIGYLGIATDITEQKKAEITLKESEYKFKSLFETSSDAIFIMNNSVFLDCNDKTCEIFGCEKNRIIHHSPSDFSPEFQPDGNKSSELAFKRINAAMNGDPQFFEWIHNRLDKTEFIAEVSLNRIIIKGEYLLHAVVRDISERKKAEILIRESEEKYRALMLNLNEAIMFVDNDDKVQFVNKRFTELIGYHSEEIIGKIAHQTLLDPKDYDVLKKVNSERTKGISSQYELDFIKKDGNIIEFLISGAPLFDNLGKITGSIGTMTDISERKKMEKALAESEEKFRSIVQTLNDSITIIDIEGKVTYQSLSAFKTFGYTENEITGQKLLDFIHPDDLELVQKELSKIFSYSNDGIPDLLRIKHKNGHYIFIEATGINLISNKAINGIVLVSRDVTDKIKTEKLLKQSEERYRITIEQTGQLVYDLDINSKEIIWSGAIEQITGFSPDEFKSVNLKGWSELVHPEDLGYATELLNRAISEIGHYNVEYRFRTKKDDYIYIDDNGIVLPDEKCRALRMLGTMKDITDRKNAEIAIRQKSSKIESQNEEFQQLNEELLQTNDYLVLAKKRAEESDKLKTAFLTNISHEIRTPMNGILGFAELLKMPGLSDQKNEEFINLIEQSGQRMLNIINDIVDIAKIESNQIQLHYQQTHVNNLLKHLQAFFMPDAQKKGLNLFCNAALPDNLCTIESDLTKLNQILTNLIKNALKFTNSGSIHFGYKLIDHQLEFFVKDTGIGIHPSQQNSIFERFIQGSTSLNRNYEGAGLGLAISKSYIEKLGGKIWLESELGIGSTFRFNIPYNFKLIEDSKQISKIELDLDFERFNILVVEDDEASMFYLKEILSKKVNTIIFANNGQEAIEMIKKNREIDIVLMDLKMPVLDGYEATRQIRQFNTHIIIIAQTAFAAPDDRNKALSAGCNDYISKPIKRELLFEILSKYRIK